MSAVHNPATPAANPSTSLAADAVAKAGQFRKGLAGASRSFNLGDACAAAGYVALSSYGLIFVVNAALVF
ncbi:MAG: hypothetical protein K8R18_08630 [Parvibaculum sp.]|uniref:hypothetical protein n=1 Tax=Parvibaculum sp. TaxID=2024848 RepID=UPI0025DDBFEB|nr:hypothetical protein [Parvibaculum sp.]MCE9649672.1 hypothetical protein [Parvibaculum sp.]